MRIRWLNSCCCAAAAAERDAAAATMLHMKVAVLRYMTEALKAERYMNMTLSAMSARHTLTILRSCRERMRG